MIRGFDRFHISYCAAARRWEVMSTSLLTSANDIEYIQTTQRLFTKIIKTPKAHASSPFGAARSPNPVPLPRKLCSPYGRPR